MSAAVTPANVKDILDQYAGSKTPGLQYVAVDASHTLFEYAGGWAGLRDRRPMQPDTTMMAYSMTKTFTAVAVLQLVEHRTLGLEDELDRYVPDTPYRGRHITVRQMLDHTSGIPNPVPLRWIHLADDPAPFDESAALARVLRDNPKLAFQPGQKYGYSNIGYWLLGKIVEAVSGQTYTEYVRVHLLRPLALDAQTMDFVIPDPARHANGYLARYSPLNLVKGFVVDRQVLGAYEGNWLRLKNHNLNGPAFGGLVGTARGFGRFLQDQLSDDPVLLSRDTRRLLETRQTDNAGQAIAMTLGWHIGERQGVRCLYKEGGGGGFHSEMCLYPTQGIGTVVMANTTEFDVSGFFSRVDRAFWGPVGRRPSA